MNTNRQSPFANITPVVKNLIIINIIFYFATWLLGRQNIDLTTLLSAHYFDSPLFKPWQIVTYMFMHDPGHIDHILFNMFGLFVFGPTLETTMGSKRFINFYFITGIGSLLLHWGVQAIELHNLIGSFTVPNIDTLSVSPQIAEKVGGIFYGAILGASGAIFGVLVGFALIFPNVELYIMFIPIPVKAKYVVPAYIAIELYSGFGQFAGDSVAHFAHLGGALFGFIMVKIWGLDKRNNFYN